MNFRIDFPPDNSRCRILKTGAAVDLPHVWPSLKMARVALENMVGVRASDLKISGKAACKVREEKLEEEPTPIPVADQVARAMERVDRAPEVDWTSDPRLTGTTTDTPPAVAIAVTGDPLVDEVASIPPKLRRAAT